MIIKENESKFTPVPGGLHPARCISLIDLGTQSDPLYGRSVPKVMVMWELPDLPLESDPNKPMSIMKEYTQSMDPKATLRKHLHSWRGRDFSAEELKGFDLKAVLDKPCVLNVLQEQKPDGKIRSRVESVSPLPKSMKVGDRFHPITYYSITQGRDEGFRSLPDWLREKINKCLEWNAGAEQPEEPSGPEAMVDREEEAVPF
jgi:hypothetical protein